MIYANLGRDGIVHFDPEPAHGGALEVAGHENEELLRDAVSRVSRLAYDGKTWIAAAVRDAGDDEEKALRGALDYRRRLRQAIADEEAEVLEGKLDELRKVREGTG